MTQPSSSPALQAVDRRAALLPQLRLHSTHSAGGQVAPPAGARAAPLPRQLPFVVGVAVLQGRVRGLKGSGSGHVQQGRWRAAKGQQGVFGGSGSDTDRRVEARGKAGGRQGDDNWVLPGTAIDLGAELLCPGARRKRHAARRLTLCQPSVVAVQRRRRGLLLLLLLLHLLAVLLLQRGTVAQCCACRCGCCRRCGRAAAAFEGGLTRACAAVVAAAAARSLLVLLRLRGRRARRCLGSGGCGNAMPRLVLLLLLQRLLRRLLHRLLLLCQVWQVLLLAQACSGTGAGGRCRPQRKACGGSTIGRCCCQQRACRS